MASGGQYDFTALNGRTISINQGKALGGSSAINAFVFVPPSKDLINAWESLGNEGWNWEILQKYFTKAYTSPPVDQSNRTLLGIDKWATTNNAAKSPIQTSFSGDVTHPIRQAWAKTFTAMGYHMKGDPFIDPTVGSFSCLASIHPETKERSFSASAYYQPVKGRENLHGIWSVELAYYRFKHYSDYWYRKPSGYRICICRTGSRSG
ncbi:hypothetical protein F5Y06DRAFT_294518 [Hypoxylon sp. FL0890]|nr:hypothetical protein F5Y06DRAFT_294518 [Hypoxylon sp. FL0890]